MRSLGIDPDLHSTGIALVENGKTVLAVRCPLVSSNFRKEAAVVQMAGAMEIILAELFSEYGKPDVCAVESQKVYLKSRVRPQDLIDLSKVAGVAIGLVRAYYSAVRIECIGSKTWKGDVPKPISQKRILRSVGIPFEPGTVPTKILRLPEGIGFEKLTTKAQMIDVIDAIGLAVWGSTL